MKNNIQWIAWWMMLLMMGLFLPAQPPVAESSNHHQPTLLFIPNQGQFDPTVQFMAQGSAGTFWFTPHAQWLTILPTTNDAQFGINLRFSFVGANPNPIVEGFQPMPTRFSYFQGEQWQTDIPTYGGLRYRELYPGIDLEVSGTTQRFIVRQPAALNLIRWQIEGANGIEATENSVIVSTNAGTIALPLFQLLTPEGTPFFTNSQPQNAGTQILTPFAPPTHPPNPSSFTLTPTLTYASFLGGIDWVFGKIYLVDTPGDIAVDAIGQAYVTGTTYAPNFPTVPGSFDTIPNGASETFVVKFSADGSTLEYATFLGGSSSDFASHIILTPTGEAIVVGTTSSTNFPITPGAFDTSFNGIQDGYITKLNANGTGLVFSTFLGGNDFDFASGELALDDQGYLFVVGSTQSDDFPVTPEAYDPTLNGGADAFVLKMNPTGTAIVYGTFVGGSLAVSSASSVAVDSAGNAYVVGDTRAANFPTTPGAFDTSFDGGYDGFAFKLNVDGSDLLYSTFLNGNGGNYDFATDIAADSNGYAYITGHTSSSTFPTTPGAFDTSMAGSGDGFALKLNPLGNQLSFSTFLGGDGFTDDPGELLLNSDGTVYLAGSTNSTDFPTTPDAMDSVFNGPLEAYLVHLNANGSELLYASYFGGNSSETATGMASDGNGGLYLTGDTFSPNFPVTDGAFDTVWDSYVDLYVAKFELGQTDCSTACLRSSQILLWGNPINPLLGQAVGLVHVTDEMGLPIANALINVEWTLPNGSIRERVGLTNENGWALFLTVAGRGSYTLTITNITKPNYTFDPANSLLSKVIKI